MLDPDPFDWVERSDPPWSITRNDLPIITRWASVLGSFERSHQTLQQHCRPIWQMFPSKSNLDGVAERKRSHHLLSLVSVFVNPSCCQRGAITISGAACLSNSVTHFLARSKNQLKWYRRRWRLRWLHDNTLAPGNGTVPVGCIPNFKFHLYPHRHVKFELKSGWIEREWLYYYI